MYKIQLTGNLHLLIVPQFLWVWSLKHKPSQKNIIHPATWKTFCPMDYFIEFSFTYIKTKIRENKMFSNILGILHIKVPGNIAAFSIIYLVKALSSGIFPNIIFKSGML